MTLHFVHPQLILAYVTVALPVIIPRLVTFMPLETIKADGVKIVRYGIACITTIRPQITLATSPNDATL